jgi:tetratricopeptide (TPR) repeat protein
MRLLERVLASNEKIYGPDHPELAQTLFNLGLSWSDLGDDTQARRYLERALAIYERTVEPDHPLLLKALSFLADQHRQNGRAAAARSLDQRVLDITGSRLAADPENLPLLAARVRALLGLGRIDEARPLVASLKASGWTDSGFAMLCRKHGL